MPTDEIESTISKWCELNGYEKGEREDWISVTVEKAYDFIISRQEKKSRETTTMPDACNRYLDILERGAPQHIRSGISRLDASMDGVGR